MTIDEINQRIEAAWAAGDPPRPSIAMDWLGMEGTLRGIIGLTVPADRKVALMDEAIAAYTRRGHVLAQGGDA